MPRNMNLQSVNPAASTFPFAVTATLGATAGVAYALSPATVCFFGAMVALFWWAARGASARERRWIWGVLAVAVALRVLLIAALFIVSDGRPVATFPWEPDSTLYKSRSMALARVWQETPFALWSFSAALDHGTGWSLYAQVLACLQFLLGRSPYGINLFSTALTLTSTVWLHRLVRPSFGPVPAILGLALLVFWPSWLTTSVSSLRDPLFWFLLAVATACCISMVRSRVWTHRAAFGVLALGACAPLDSLRPEGTVVAICGLSLGLASAAVARRATTALLIATLLAMTTVFLWAESSVRTRVLTAGMAAANRSAAAVSTYGVTYKLLDDRFYGDFANATTTMTPVEVTRYVARAIASVLLYPLPWQNRSTRQLVFIPQQVVWYVFVGLAAVGVVAGFRRDVLLTSVLASMTLIHLAVVGLSNGNFGTLVRHRDTVFPFIVWLGALGSASFLAALLPRRAVEPTE